MPQAGNDIDIDAARAARLIDEDGAQIIDVREPYEVQAGRLAGARHIALGRLGSEAATIDRDRPVVFYCRVGGRSAMAATAFRQAGYEAYSLAGGLLDWHRQGRPLEPEGGTVADH
jgi:rhodanese-related sulfurtransferase